MLMFAAASAASDLALSGRGAVGGILGVDPTHMLLGDQDLGLLL